DGIAGIAQIDEPYTLDDAAVLHVEAGDDALGQHGSGSARAGHAAARSARFLRAAQVDRARIEGAADDRADDPGDPRQPPEVLDPSDASRGEDRHLDLARERRRVVDVWPPL